MLGHHNPSQDGGARRPTSRAEPGSTPWPCSRLGTEGAGCRLCERPGNVRPARVSDPRIGGADISETLRGRDLHLDNLFELQDLLTKLLREQRGTTSK